MPQIDVISYFVWDPNLLSLLLLLDFELLDQNLISIERVLSALVVMDQKALGLLVL